MNTHHVHLMGVRRTPGGLAGTIGEADAFREHERTGRPLGSASFLEKLERRLARALRPLKPGPKRKEKER
jgi:hypothetical protein